MKQFEARNIHGDKLMIPASMLKPDRITLPQSGFDTTKFWLWVAAFLLNIAAWIGIIGVVSWLWN